MGWLQTMLSEKFDMGEFSFFFSKVPECLLDCHFQFIFVVVVFLLIFGIYHVQKAWFSW